MNSRWNLDLLHHRGIHLFDPSIVHYGIRGLDRVNPRGTVLPYNGIFLLT
jgi:hypothetical protein